MLNNQSDLSCLKVLDCFNIGHLRHGAKYGLSEGCLAPTDATAIIAATVPLSLLFQLHVVKRIEVWARLN